MPIRVLLLVLLLLPALAFQSPALAIDPAYLGYWAPDAESCIPSDAIEITPQGLSGPEETCQTKEAHKEGKGWVVRLRCAVEGNETDVTLHWRLGQDGRLRGTQDGQTTTYVRCRKMRH